MKCAGRAREAERELVNLPIVDADTHINEPPDLWTKRMPARFQDRAPRVIERANGSKAWTFESRQMTVTPLVNAVGTSPVQWTLFGDAYNSGRPGGWDPAARLEDMAIDMVGTHVLFPTYVLAGGPAFSWTDREFQIACIRAYNDWISEFASYAPDRLIAVGLTPSTGLDDMIAEAKRVSTLPGIRGLLLTTWPNGHDQPKHEEDDGFWSVIEDLNLAVIIHVGFQEGSEVEAASDAADQQAQPTPPGDGEGKEEKKEDRTRRITLPMLNQERQAISMIPLMSHFILGGVLERHPRLRIGAAEVGAGWVPFFLEQTNDNFSRHRFWTDCKLSMLPSEYWYRQCFTTFQVDRYAIRNRDLVGVGTMMWSSDYPHTGADWPNSRTSIDAQLLGVPEADARKMLCENALRLYGLTTDDVAKDPAGVAASR
jgi:predicted TIM-barrel fold metal-dependent hydrolase